MFVDPDMSIKTVRAERGRDLLPAFHDVLEASFRDAGYRVVATASDAHDLTAHVRIGQVGYTYGSWADDVVVEVTGAGQPVAEVRRRNVNWVTDEGATEKARLSYAANVTVNALSRDPRVEQFAASHPMAAAGASPAAAPAAPPPSQLAAPASPLAAPPPVTGAPN